MGVADSKQILSRIQNQYKSIRKYCDPVYGEITVIQHKTSKRYYAMIEKTFLKSSTVLEQYLNQNTKSNYLLKLQKYQVCDLSICSDLLLYFFLFEYSSNTLEQQITRRQEQNKHFTKIEAINIFLQQVETAIHIKKKLNPQTGKPCKFLLNNNNYLCSPILELRVLQPVFRNDPQGFDDMSSAYLSPQAHVLLIRGQHYRLRELCNKQSSIVFTMGLNFIECLLLADMSMLYEDQAHQQGLNYKKLNNACEQILQNYGEDIYIILIKMTHPDQKMRIGLQQVKRSLKILKINRKSMVRYDKLSSTQIC